MDDEKLNMMLAGERIYILYLDEGSNNYEDEELSHVDISEPSFYAISYSDKEIMKESDFAFRNEKSEEWYLQQLKGHKHLVIGNHDRKLLKNAAAMRYFESVDKMMHVSDDGNQIFLCHFPLAEWNGFKKGHSHIHGHIHNRKDATWKFMRTRHNAYNAGRIGDCKIRQIIIY